MSDLIADYIKLFRGRGDAYGTWAGGSVREPLTPEKLAAHLTSGDQADWIGVYPHLGGALDQHVTWGCIDIDGKDFPMWEAGDDHPKVEGHDWLAMIDLAIKLQKVLAVKDVYAHIERTRNGYHLWVFPRDGHVAAATMRRALMAACKACKYDPKEVNPKQETLEPGKLGNYVRLPYYGYFNLDEGDVMPDRYFVSGYDGDPMNLQRFLAEVELTKTPDLEAVAKLWTPPARVTFDGPPPENVKDILPLLSGMAYTIWKDGPLEGRDRSNTLMKLAYTLRDEGIQQPAAFAIVRDADARWGKFADRPDCDEQIMSIVTHAYSV